MEQPFLSLEGFGPESCLYECIKHHRCQSINIDENKSICQLNGKAWDSELSTRFLSNKVGWKFISPTKERMLVREISILRRTLQGSKTFPTQIREHRHRKSWL